MEPLLVRFTKKQRAKIRRIARKNKMSEAAVVRFWVDIAFPDDYRVTPGVIGGAGTK